MENICIELHPNDDVLIARDDIPAGTPLTDTLRTTSDIPASHKVARRAIARGAPVHRYNQVIGFAAQDIQAGEHVHSHNLEMGRVELDYAFCRDARPTPPPAAQRTFMGIRRADGRVATRNYIAVISSVNCSATAAKMIGDHYRNALDGFPNVDGVLALTHKSGCGLDHPLPGINALKSALAGYARHPNIAHVIVVGLGCEIANLGDVLGGAPGDSYSIQAEGGTRKLVDRVISRIDELLPAVNAVQREPVPLSALTLAMQCGGSSGISGISCNPALGHAVDLLVQQGGTAILSETTECYGAEHLLTARAASEEVGRKLVERIKWWEDFTARNSMVIDNNPSPGNKAGGLTTIIEKSLGSIAKGGTTSLNEVYQYAEPVEAGKGLVFMDAPAFDPVGATAQVAGGATLMVFTTDRGSAFGCKPAPSIKLAGSTSLFERMPDDMDINAGTILDGSESVEVVGARIFERIIAVASGERSLSEAMGYGEEEFCPWDMGVML
ncbi:altronate dehydratase [Seongchinamella sediminis]|uniref:Altronate dehydratase n=1 Tax=Seongchinamella sediminis TaxID=2283635 RepID=A0A3L7E1R6_9GAMM|nr:altronate dehydratase family protein [Seongchinamella sediminis]RLQ22273.1 altronate dehydratase [Seongchinamella sediminis]